MNSKIVVYIGTLHAKPEFIDSLIQSFEGLKQAAGYISHECYRDLENRNKLTLVEQWENKEDHENFVNSFPTEVMEQWLGMLSQEGEDSYFEKLK
ncbi:antibiotic biosynthesis monooxygenase family protein [Dasania marina]|uniref:putative quinol monooxygenase n=1 Tax=Dasania marina TaxID=471499 RepID=UPI0030D9A2D8|tara:strand:- start:17449 stop:17733 length:285 start_codon:yes stop_codon:yes gene_type:complete